MKKEAFLRALDKRLEGMSAEERARALEFCAESIDDRVCLLYTSPSPRD